MTNRNTKIQHAATMVAIFMMVAVIFYAVGCYPLYIYEKSKVMNQLYDELKDMEISNMDDDDRESLNEYQKDKIDILIVDSKLQEIYSSRGDISQSYIEKKFQNRLNDYEEEGMIDKKSCQFRQRLIFRGKLRQQAQDYYVYMRKDVQSAYEVVHASSIYLAAVSVFLVLMLFWIYRNGKKGTNENSEQAELQLKEKQSEFVANISHELKTPIAVVSSQIEMLEMMGDQIDREYYFSSIHEELDKMTKMIGELLDFSMLNNALDTMEIGRVDISEMMNYLLMRYEGLFRKKGIRIENEIAPEIIVKGNQMYLERAVNNYLMNAMQHTGQGKKICVTVKKEKCDVCINVFNEGEKIAEDQMSHIWESFYTLSKKKKIVIHRR